MQKLSTPQNESKEKLIKWYGWIFILFLCFTPLVFILLPVLMINVNHFNRMLRESLIKEDLSLEGNLSQCTWEAKNDNGLNCISGEMEIIVKDEKVNCSFLKYVKKAESLPSIEQGRDIRVTGAYDDKGVLKVRTIKDFNSEIIYTTEPSISVY